MTSKQRFQGPSPCRQGNDSIIREQREDISMNFVTVKILNHKLPFYFPCAAQLSICFGLSVFLNYPCNTPLPQPTNTLDNRK